MNRAIAIFAAAALLALLPLTLPAQAHPQDRESAERHGTVRLGEVTQVHPGIMVRPLAVVEDSRCPINALCIQAGRLVLRIELDDRGRRSEHLLTLQAPARLAGGTLNLTSAQPHPGAVSPPVLPGEMWFSFSYQPDTKEVRADK